MATGRLKIKRQSPFIRRGLSMYRGGPLSAGGRIITREQKRWQVRQALGVKG